MIPPIVETNSPIKNSKFIIEIKLILKPEKIIDNNAGIIIPPNIIIIEIFSVSSRLFIIFTSNSLAVLYSLF